MIRAMAWQTAEFFLVILAFMFAMGVSTQGLMYHNVPVDLKLIKNVFLPAFFVIGGEYYTKDDMLNVPNCAIIDTNRTQTDIYSHEDCMDINGTPVALSIYVIYLLVLNILLVNLLIAIFTNTYSEIEAESDKIWMTQRYTLVYEYFHKPTIFSPFTGLYYLYYFTVRFGSRMLRASVCINLKPSKQSKLKSAFFNLSQKYRNGFSMKCYFSSISGISTNKKLKEQFTTYYTKN